MDKSILEVVHDTAKDLNDAGVMDDMTLREFDALCLPPVHPFSANDIKKLRKRIKVSQGVFAAYLNTSPSTIRQWEQGKKTPSGMSLKLLNLVEKKGLEVLA